jgi:hypothetical protein
MFRALLRPCGAAAVLDLAGLLLGTDFLVATAFLAGAFFALLVFRLAFRDPLVTTGFLAIFFREVTFFADALFDFACFFVGLFLAGIEAVYHRHMWLTSITKAPHRRRQCLNFVGVELSGFGWREQGRRCQGFDELSLCTFVRRHSRHPAEHGECIGLRILLPNI